MINFTPRLRALAVGCAGLAFGGAVLFSQGCVQQNDSANGEKAADGTPVKLASLPPGKLLPRFPDFGHMPAPGQYTGRIFKLSQEYPQDKPTIGAAERKFLDIDFYKDWNAYILAVRDYIYEGNIEHDGVANDFYLEDNKVRRWYHVPWQHYGPHGREGIHGLTKEGPVNPLTLNPAQKDQWQTYAVGFYNAPGGYTIGRTWADAENPDVTITQSEGFPEGTVVGKVLFTTAPVNQVPFLQNPIEWDAYTALSYANDSVRQMSKVRFIQMDIMVRDSRAAATGGWVFGTFVYNGALNNSNPWLNVVPVGLMWGNDPTVTDNIVNAAPVKTITNPNLKQTIINTSAQMPPMHLGWGMRLNGPVDNVKSSCMSCHSTAEFPEISPIMPTMATPAPQPGTPAWMRWFRNVPCAKPFDAQATSADYSLQLAASIQNFLIARSATNGGSYSVQYWKGQAIKPILGMRGTSEPQQKQEVKELQMVLRRK
ncbi:hypothetical protein EJV47_12835 [Hymenobacter gummosus]|uniref:Cytochrome c domain-containing protein n=1 Tax=Hymenobacter gummosus TaxID=1776032 RepID=A0A431U2Z0_9BACT|nr:hypothetical protein [Hymenobacter gummosus]RTQ49693.1 hypothetical protein EJV47_12835 [Hymenobacter gummosus]